MSKVFIIDFHVKKSTNSIMPDELEGAYVSCFVAEENYINATQKVLKKLMSDGLYPEEILEPINEIELSSWEDYLTSTWPECINDLPCQEDFEQTIKSGKIVYGPFQSYSS